MKLLLSKTSGVTKMTDKMTVKIVNVIHLLYIKLEKKKSLCNRNQQAFVNEKSILESMSVVVANK